MNNPSVTTKPVAFRWSGDPLTIDDLDRWAADISQDAPVGSAQFSNAIHVS